MNGDGGRPRQRSRRRRSQKIEFLGAFCLVGVALDRRRRAAARRQRVAAGGRRLATRRRRVADRSACRPRRCACSAEPRVTTLAPRRDRGTRAAVAPSALAGPPGAGPAAARMLRRSCVFLLARWSRSSSRACRTSDGAFVGLLQFREYFGTPALQQSIWNTLWVATVVTAITVPLAFTYAYALTRSRMPGKVVFRVIALTPILAPSLLAAISFIQWFGNQGLLKGLLGGASVYGPIGIIISSVYATFPHALMIVAHRAAALRRPALRGRGVAAHADAGGKFFTITLPGAQVRPRQRGDGRVLLHGERLRHPEGDRRQLQRAGGRHLQAGDRPAELQQGRGGRAHPAAAGARRLRRRLVDAGPPAGAVLGARGAVRRPSAARWFDAAMFAFCARRCAVAAARCSAWRCTRR